MALVAPIVMMVAVLQVSHADVYKVGRSSTVGNVDDKRWTATKTSHDGDIIGPTPNALASSGLTDKMDHLQLSDYAGNEEELDKHKAPLLRTVFLKFDKLAIPYHEVRKYFSQFGVVKQIYYDEHSIELHFARVIFRSPSSVAAALGGAESNEVVINGKTASARKYMQKPTNKVASNQ